MFIYLVLPQGIFADICLQITLILQERNFFSSLKRVQELFLVTLNIMMREILITKLEGNAIGPFQSCYFFFAAFTGFFLAFAFAISCFASSFIDIYAYWSYHTYNIAYWRFCMSMISLTPILPPRNTTRQNITKTPQTRGKFSFTLV